MNRKEAEIVSLTFDLYLLNVGSSRIGELLDYLGVKTVTGTTWESGTTVIKKTKSMRATSLLNPFLTLHAIGRNGYEHENIKYFVAVTIEAKGYKGNLYDNILQTYSNLLPIEIHNVNKVMVPVE